MVKYVICGRGWVKETMAKPALRAWRLEYYAYGLQQHFFAWECIK